MLSALGGIMTRTPSFVALSCVLLFGLAGGARSTRPRAKEVPKRPAIVGVSHIGLRTDNLDAARAFYSKILGFSEAFSLDDPPGKMLLTYFKVNDHQFIEVFPELKDPKEDRLSHIAFETSDAEQLRAYLGSRGVDVPAQLDPMLDGNRGFEVKDPDGHTIEFVQLMPGSLHTRDFGKHLPDTRISQHIIHVGVTVRDRAAADKFYEDVLGFQQTWQGGMKDTEVDWVDMRVPDGTDWLEYMLNVGDHPSPRTLGVVHHFALGVPSVAASYKELLQRDPKLPEKPQIGRDGKWQLNLYDPNLTRAELMEPKPVRKPCCSPMTQ
jgi:catechol 2,3-dioxygenase-like lactoylglutathione lyase family enzyme